MTVLLVVERERERERERESPWASKIHGIKVMGCLENQVYHGRKTCEESYKTCDKGALVKMKNVCEVGFLNSFANLLIKTE